VNRIFAVVVLYQMLPEQSPSFCALQEAVLTRPSLRARLDLLIVDNSPQSHALPVGAFGRYLHDGANPGLARRYNDALDQATAAKATWLLLLDQDTTLTVGYFDQLELLTAALADDPHIVGILPRLIAGDRLLSPHIPAFRSSAYRLHLGVRGLLGGLIRAFNSGAILRISALQSIGGFPEQYWLDYLDHATFHQLQALGGEFFIMDVSLEHEMSIHRAGKHADPANAGRHRNQLAAQMRFYQEHGTPEERRRNRLNLVSRAWNSLIHAHFAEAGRLLQAALSSAHKVSA
jgi:GT2 family glycosyltransferase